MVGIALLCSDMVWLGKFEMRQIDAVLSAGRSLPIMDQEMIRALKTHRTLTEKAP